MRGVTIGTCTLWPDEPKFGTGHVSCVLGQSLGLARCRTSKRVQTDDIYILTMLIYKGAAAKQSTQAGRERSVTNLLHPLARALHHWRWLTPALYSLGTLQALYMDLPDSTKSYLCDNAPGSTQIILATPIDYQKLQQPTCTGSHDVNQWKDASIMLPGL